MHPAGSSEPWRQVARELALRERDGSTQLHSHPQPNQQRLHTDLYRNTNQAFLRPGRILNVTTFWSLGLIYQLAFNL